jgi:hypothetical protein
MALNDIPNRKKGEDSALFVNDTMFLTTAKTFREANQKLSSMMNKAITWAQDHNSDFEVSKSALIGFTHKRTTSTRQGGQPRPLIACPPLSFNGATVPVVDQHKFLGVIIDHTLLFKFQANTALAKGTSYIGALHRIAKPNVGSQLASYDTSTMWQQSPKSYTQPAYG